MNPQTAQPPPGVDMSLIREALARRMGGGPGSPEISQMAQPGGAIPTGGPNIPTPQPGMPPQANPNQLPAQGGQLPASSATPTQSLAKGVGAATGFPDPQTRDMAKALLGKLVQFL